MLIAMGEVYEKLNRFDEAMRCYKRARNVGDVDSFALSRLARSANDSSIFSTILCFCVAIFSIGFLVTDCIRSWMTSKRQHRRINN